MSDCWTVLILEATGCYCSCIFWFQCFIDDSVESCDVISIKCGKRVQIQTWLVELYIGERKLDLKTTKLMWAYSNQVWSKQLWQMWKFWTEAKLKLMLLGVSVVPAVKMAIIMSGTIIWMMCIWMIGWIGWSIDSFRMWKWCGWNWALV